MGISCPWLIVVWVAYPFQSLSLTWTYLCLFVFALLTRGTSAIWRRWRKACRCITPSPSSLRFPSSKTPYRTYVRTFFFFFFLSLFRPRRLLNRFFKYDVFLIFAKRRAVIRYPCRFMKTRHVADVVSHRSSALLFESLWGGGGLLRVSSLGWFPAYAQGSDLCRRTVVRVQSVSEIRAWPLTVIWPAGSSGLTKLTRIT